MIHYILLFACILLGFITGSFLNVVSLRFNTGKSLGGRSQCFSCSRQLRWYELIPVFSFLIQKGRCRNCSVLIPKHLLMTEVLAGVFFGIIGGRALLHIPNYDLLNPPYLFASLYLIVIFSLLIVIFLYDFRHKIIPDGFSIAFGALAFVGMFFFGFDHGVFAYLGFHIPTLINLCAGLLVPLPFFLVWLFSKGSLIGLGDPKLMVGIGFLLGFSRGMSAVFLAFWMGSLFALALVVVQKLQLFPLGKKGILKMEVPFAPFLILGTLFTVAFAFNFLPL